MAERKLDIFRVLNAANTRKQDFYSSLTDEEKKGFAPSVIMRWMSGTSSPLQVYLINETVNPYAFSLYKHPDLLWKLMTVANIGKNQRYAWNKLPSRKETGKSNAIRLLCEYFGYNVNHAADALELLSRDRVLEIASEMGWQPEDIAKIKRELKSSKDDDSDEPKAKKKKAAPINDLMEF